MLSSVRADRETGFHATSGARLEGIRPHKAMERLVPRHTFRRGSTGISNLTSIPEEQFGPLRSPQQSPNTNCNQAGGAFCRTKPKNLQLQGGYSVPLRAQHLRTY